ncbi:hypothetical protein KVT40_002372 [Elsinoe batatas]|uniref:Chaperone/heat shock protein Hsp12 n=1 Tax=Elsinoe batatas TaxID=2601811 RepID=A0A8K0L9U7_9PEZI|nr:hypothetical protein KVT40_002372 [Elsinoe batatas]
MSDAGRKDFTDKATEKMTPQSSKSTTDKISESVTNATDSASRSLQPDSSKSGTQEALDKTTRTKHNAQGESLLDKTKGALGMDKK